MQNYNFFLKITQMLTKNMDVNMASFCIVSHSDVLAIFMLFVTEFAEKWANFRVLQKFHGSQKVPKNGTELAKR